METDYTKVSTQLSALLKTRYTPSEHDVVLDAILFDLSSLRQRLYTQADSADKVDKKAGLDLLYLQIEAWVTSTTAPEGVQ